MASIPIGSTRTTSGNQPSIGRFPEGATITVKTGTPVFMSSGALIEWDGDLSTNLIAGISMEAGSNLAAAGVAETLTFGEVINQPSAVNIPRGAPINDGNMGIELAVEDTVFRGKVDTGTVSASDIGSIGDLVKDGSGGLWGIDISAPGENVVRVVAIDADDDTILFFVFLQAARQILA